MPDSDQEKTEQPTPKRREEARNKGEVAVSKEVNSAVVLMASLSAFSLLGVYLSSRMMTMAGDLWGRAAEFRISLDNVYDFFYGITSATANLLWPFMLVIAICGLAANVVQTRFLLSFEAMKPSISKLNPIKGFKNLFSLRSLTELVKSIFKMAIIGYTAYTVIRREYDMLPVIADLSPIDIGQYAIGIMLRLLLYTTTIFLALAALDYAYQHYEHEKKLKMTKEEVKEEFKQREGDPMIKARVRSIQREMSRRRMVSSVKQADVVVTNPTHLAVALEYKREKMHAPTVVAKGAGFMAERIKEIARSNQVPILERKGLAQILYKTVEVGREVPEGLYKAIAEILAYVYRIKNRSLFPQQGGRMR